MVYQYVAYNDNGEVVKGKLPATSEQAAIDLLGYAGYQAIKLEPHVPFLSLDKLSASLFPPKPADIILLYRQLAMLLESGIDIITSLELSQGQAANRTLKRVLREVISDLRNGNQLSAALDKHPKVFFPTYCRLLSVGEQSGDLEAVLRQVADYMEQEVTATKETKNALIIPVITAIVSVVTIGVLVTFVIPRFGSLYSSLGLDLPLPAQILITAANMAQSYGMYILLAVSVIAGWVFLYIKTPDGKYKWDRLVLSLPIVGRVSYLNQLTRYCRSMSLLLRAGLPLNEVISLAVRSGSNRVISRALTNVQQDMVKGEGLSRPMAKNNLFLPMMVQMVRIGEETGNLDSTLLAVARSYEAEAEHRTRFLITHIQPAMTLIIGLIVGLIALCLTSAMYSMYGQGF